MGFLRKVLDRLLFKQRDISLLGGDGDEVAERVDLSGGPLKPEHRRRALRDKRLLPKRITLRRGPRGKRPPRHFPKEQADRLFSRTLRTKDRNARDLLADEDQLQRYGLPVWLEEEDVADALGISIGMLRHFSIHRDRETVMHYVRFAVPKRSGGERIIMAPKRRLKALQRVLLDQLVSKLPCSEVAHGFRPGRSVRSGAEAHVGKAVVVHMDLKDFFPSVHFGRVRGMFISYGYSFPVASTLAALMTEADRQPVEVDNTIYHVPVGSRHCVQGAPTSPAICNAIVLRMDRRLQGLAQALGFAYTRYADDLAFSSDQKEKIGCLLGGVTRIVREEGFAVNERKTRVMRRGGRQRVTGVTVNETLGLSRGERRLLRAQIHRLAHDEEPELRRYVEGRLAYLEMLNPSQAEALRKRLPSAAPGS